MEGHSGVNSWPGANHSTTDSEFQILKTFTYRIYIYHLRYVIRDFRVEIKLFS